MLFKKPIQKTKNFLLKTLKNIKILLFGSYDSIPRTLFSNPLSCTSINQRTNQLDHVYVYSQYSNRSVPYHGHDNSDHPMKETVETSPQNDITGNDHSSDSTVMNQELAPRKNYPSSASSSCRYPNDGTYILAQKMKELDMMGTGDVDHALDVEEALNYYSRLSCPVYVNIVDKFFMDMYADFLLPQSSITFSSSSRRLEPLKL